MASAMSVAFAVPAVPAVSKVSRGVFPAARIDKIICVAMPFVTAMRIQHAWMRHRLRRDKGFSGH